MKVAELIRYYELKIQSIEALMPEYRKWGADKYYQHRLSLYQEFVDHLYRLERDGGNNG